MILITFKNRKLDTGFYFNKATYGVSRIVKNVPSFRYDLTYKESIKPDNIQRVASQIANFRAIQRRIY